MQQPRAPVGHFGCSLCSATFGRAEHLTRHRLSHTNTKPFSCPVCSKGFTRRDTLNRHLPIHAAAKSRSGGETPIIRASQACTNCARLRMRCDGQPACARCQAKRIECVYSGRTRRRVAIIQDAALPDAAAAAALGSATDTADASPTVTMTMRDHAGTHSLEQNAASASAPPPLSIVAPVLLQPSDGETQSQSAPPVSSPSIDFSSSNELTAGEPVPSDGHASSMPTSFMSTDYLSQGDLAPYDKIALDWNWDENASLIDWMTIGPEPSEPFLSLLAQSPANSDFNCIDFDHPMPDRPCSRRPSRPSDSGAAESASSVHQWPTDWNPVVVDNIVAFPDLTSASLDIVEAENFAHVGLLTQQSYEDMRQCLRQLETNRTLYRPFRNGNLPPIHVMDCFLQLYFEYFHPVFPILHQATFEPSKTPWQLTLGLCAVGARYSKLSSAGLCANALQELLRRAIAITIERDNSIVRELWITQAMILNSIGMVYSGNKRFFEVAEAVRCSPAIQCRRNGSLKPTINSVTVYSGSSDRSTEVAWRQWIYEESRRRLGFSAFLMDAQIVLYLDSNPCLLPSELEQQLPCNENLWAASTAEEWIEQYLKYSTTTVPTVDVAIEQLRQKKPSPPIIGDFARLVLVFVTYVEAAAIRKSSNSLLFAGTRAVEGVIDEANRTAVAVLETLKAEARHDGDLPLRSSLNCHIHLALVLLFSPRTEVVNHAHSFKTEFKALGARRRLREWIDRDAGRHARCAAAAAGALTGLLYSNSTLGFYEPIAALLATLTMWTYSQMVEQSSDLYSFAGTEPERSAGGKRMSTVKLDNFREAWRVRDWVDGKEDVRAYIKDVGTICKPSAGDRILAMGKELVAGRSTWQLSHGLSVWLGKLRARAEGCDGRLD